MGHSFHRLIHSKFIGLLLKLALTFAAFWLALRDIDMANLKTMLSHQDRTRLIEAAALVIVQIVLGGMRWKLILAALSESGSRVMSLAEALKLYYISVFFNCCLPGTVGGDVVRVWLAKSDRVPLPLSINSVIIDRMIALVALGLLVMITLPLLADIAGFNAMTVWLCVAIMGIFGLWGLANAERLFEPVRHLRPVHWLLYFIGCLRLMIKYPAASLLSLLYALFAHVSYCLATYVLGQSLGADISILQCLTLVPLVLLAITMPISIGGWGIREAGMVGMLGMVGVPQAAALMLSVQLGLTNILVSLPAGLLWLGYRKNRAAHAQ
jgi:glycosyltransferase 2 family protein